VAVKVEDLQNWLPVDAIIADGRPALEWMDLRDLEFDEPFFAETVAQANTRQKVITDLDALLQLEKIVDSVPLSGFIFHVSRCGSTLLANACRKLTGSIVIAEAPVIDKIAARFLTDSEQNSSKEMLYSLFLRAAIMALGQRRKRDERFYFVKFACTSSLQMSRIRRIWPEVPIVFLYRDPVEVIVSNMRSSPEWMQTNIHPGAAAAVAGVNLNEVDEISSEEFCARAVGRFLEEAEKNRSENIKFVNYSQLTPDSLVEAVEFLGATPTNDEADAIRQVSRLYSKDSNRSRVFQSDSESKKASASEHILRMAEKWALPYYERLNKQPIKRGN